jgi:hypothetical protein
MKIVEGDHLVTRSYYKKDLVVISLCYGLLFASIDIEKHDTKDKHIEEGSLVAFKEEYPEGFKEMLSEAIELLKDDLFKTMSLEQHYKIAKYMKQKTNTMLAEVLPMLKKERVSLEVLTMFLLFHNFVKDREIIHSTFKIFSEVHRYELVVDTLKECGLSIRTTIDMHDLAKNILQRI